MNIRLVRFELLHADGQTDRQTDRQTTDLRTDMTKLIDAFSNFAKATNTSVTSQLSLRT